MRAVLALLALVLFAVPTSAQPTAQPTGCPRGDAGSVCLGSGGSPADTVIVVDGVSYVRVSRAGALTFPNGAILTAPALGGTVTGTYTLAGTPTLTSPTINTPTIATPTITGEIHSDHKVLAASATYSATTTPATLTGFSWTVVAGATYIFELSLPATMTTNGGLTVNFKLTTATLTSIQYDSYASTMVRIRGSFVVNAGGTFAWQATQNTSAGAGDATIVKIGSYAKLDRVL